MKTKKPPPVLQHYLDADAKAELERSSPEYRAARSRLKNEYRARQEEKQRTAQSLARRDLAANRIAASELGKTIERYAAELGEKRKSEKAANTMFNAILCGTL